MKKTISALFALILVATLLLSACAPAAPQEASGPVTIRFFHPWV